MQDHNSAKVSPEKDILEPQNSTPSLRMKITDLSEALVLRLASLGNLDTDYAKVFYERKCLQLLLELQSEDHTDPKKLFQYIFRDSIDEIKERIRENFWLKKEDDLSKVEDRLIDYRDAAGATIIHVAYLIKRYDVAQALVTEFPKLAVQPYSDKPTDHLIKKFRDNYIQEQYYEKFKMPYAGENILHMIIVRRNFDEIRWLFEYYASIENKSVSKDYLDALMNCETTGSFFGEDSTFYFGGLPLHFAASSNDIQIFDLVLNFSAHLHSGSSFSLDTYAIFKRDSFGNNILHLCVLRQLTTMYEHVVNAARATLVNEILALWSNGRKGQNTYKLSAERSNMSIKERSSNNASEESGFLMKESLLSLPCSVHDKETDMKKVLSWAEDEASRKIQERLTLALNKAHHSPFTLAGYNLSPDDPKELEAKKLEMLNFVINHRKSLLWTYGPISHIAVDLDGLELRHELTRYQDTHRLETLDHGFSVIEGLCEKAADKGFNNPIIKRIIQAKWERCGSVPFLSSLIYHGILMILQTLILIFFNITPTVKQSDYMGSVIFVDILYPICILFYLGFFVFEVMDFMTLRLSYFSFKLNGIAWYDFFIRFLKMAAFLIFCCTKAYLSSKGKNNKYGEGSGVLGWNPQDFPVAKISLAISTLLSWFHLYFFLMGFDSTGPFILTIFTVLTRDVGRFLKFYLVNVFAFACAMSLIANLGSPRAENGFIVLIYSVWNLLQMTVGGSKTPFYQLEDDGGVSSLNLIPGDLQWAQDILRTLYLGISNILMVNLLIGMIGNSYNTYMESSESILLMEKYNILAMYERSLNPVELIKWREKYTRVIQNASHYEDDYDGDNEKESNKRVHKLSKKNKFHNATFVNSIKVKEGSGRVAYGEDAIDQIAAAISSNIAHATQSATQSATKLLRRSLQMSDSAAEPLSNLNVKKYFREYQIASYIFEMEEIDNDKWESDMVSPDYSKMLTETTLFIIDPQIDFHPEGGSGDLYHKAGSLAVPGANEDSDRIAKMIEDNLTKISNIIISQDSHHREHIAHAQFWRNSATGEMPSPFTAITHNDIVTRKWVPADPKMLPWCKIYTYRLEQKGRMVLVIWPDHCIVEGDGFDSSKNTEGHRVVPVISKAVSLWEEKTKKKAQYVLKGQNNNVEMYSALEAEVVDPQDNRTALNHSLLVQLRASTRLLVCGQARSHCVSWTLRDIISHWQGDYSRIGLLKDGCSCVPSFEKSGEELIEYIRRYGVKVLTCANAFIPEADWKN